MEEEQENVADYRELAAHIVATYVKHNALAAADLPKLLAETHNQLRALSAQTARTPSAPPPTPAVAISHSIKHDSIICLDCGRSMKALKRHLAVEHRRSPEQYRARWRLAPGYPMVAPVYSEERSALAKKIDRVP